MMLNEATQRRSGRISFLLLICFALCGFGLVAHADDYFLDAGDVISVAVLGQDKLSVPSITVSTAGKISLPSVGSITVSKKTVEQVSSEITKKLRVVMNEPHVIVTLTAPRPREIFVLGAVAKPGVVSLKPGWRISEALAAAGGTTDRPELIDGSLVRANQKPISLDLAALLRDSNHAANLLLQAGDTMRFTTRTIRVTVMGQVQNAGIVEVPIGSTITEAIAAAGSPKPNAGLSRATLKRGDGTMVPMNLRSVRPGDKNLALQAGDVINIPEFNDAVTVLGAVQKPGFYPMEDGKALRIAEAVILAGGPSGKAALTRVSVQHADGTSQQVNLHKVLRLGDRDSNLALQPGDLVDIPELRGVTVLGAVLNPGTYYLDEGNTARLRDVVALVGGISIKAETSRIILSRRKASAPTPLVSTPSVPRTADAAPVTAPVTAPTAVLAVAVQELVDPSLDETVLDGDLISVTARKTPLIYINGEIERPGPYELKETDGLAELILKAGGPTVMAALSRVSVTSANGAMKIVDMHGLRTGGSKPQRVLEEGDYVVVPKNTMRVSVMAAVNRPGYYPIPENETLTVGDALNQAGGPKERARVDEIALVRQTPQGATTQILSLSKVATGDLKALNQPLQDGDVLYVPPGKVSRSFWQKFTSLISTVGVFGAIFP